MLLAGDRRDIFLVGDDDQTIYAWRLADVRRVLDLAASLPGLRRVDLVTNYRCPRPVVERAVRLIEVNSERFAKSIRAGPAAAGQLMLAPDSGDELARARRLLGDWLAREPGIHAVLARTNIELAPFAAVALERGIPYRAAEDGLALDDPHLDALLAQLPSDRRPSVALATQRSQAARLLLAWSLPYRTAAELRDAIAEAREAPWRAASGRRAARARHGARHQGTRVRPRRGHRNGRERLPQQADFGRLGRSQARNGGGAPPRLRRLDSREEVAGPRLRPAGPSQFMRDAFSEAELAWTQR